MRTPLLVVLVVALAGPAIASEEQIHPWRSASVSAPTQLFGEVAMKATADAKGNLKTLAVTVKGKVIDVPAKWIAVLPAMPLASLEIRTERGYDPDPWLYAVFHTGDGNAKGSVEIHLAFQSGRLKHASILTADGKGSREHQTKQAP